jgi:type I restriction enzyme S subunit
MQLSKYLEFKNGLNSDSKNFGKGIKYISVMDILNNRYITYDNIIGLVDVDTKTQKKYEVHYGDMLFQRSSETFEDIGQANVYLDNKPAIFGGFVIRGKKIGDYYPQFFKYLLCSPTSRKKVIVKGAGSQHYNIGQEGLSSISLSFPTMQEQKKTAQFLFLLDDRISTQNKIIEQLGSLMKALCHSIIKQKESNVRLKDCLTCHSSILMENEVLNQDGIYPVYGAAGIIAYTPQNAINEDAILIIKDGASVGKVQYAKGKYSVIGTLNYLTAKKNTSLKYIYYYLQTFNFDKYRVGSSIPHIYFKDYGNTEIFCPSFEEQERIACILSIIDEKIETEKKILKMYLEQKKYLLQNMFI